MKVSGGNPVLPIAVPDRALKIPTSLPGESSGCVRWEFRLGTYVPSYLESARSIAESMLKSARLGVPSSPWFFPDQIGWESSVGFTCSLWVTSFGIIGCVFRVHGQFKMNSLAVSFTVSKTPIIKGTAHTSDEMLKIILWLIVVW